MPCRCPPLGDTARKMLLRCALRRWYFACWAGAGRGAIGCSPSLGPLRACAWVAVSVARGGAAACRRSGRKGRSAGLCRGCRFRAGAVCRKMPRCWPGSMPCSCGWMTPFTAGVGACAKPPQGDGHCGRRADCCSAGAGALAVRNHAARKAQAAYAAQPVGQVARQLRRRGRGRRICGAKTCGSPSCVPCRRRRGAAAEDFFFAHCQGKVGDADCAMLIAGHYKAKKDAVALDAFVRQGVAALRFRYAKVKSLTK